MHAQLQTEQSKVDANGRVRQAEADLAAAEAQLAQQQAVYQLALFDKDAYTQLRRTGAVSEREGKQAAQPRISRRRRSPPPSAGSKPREGALATARASLDDARASAPPESRHDPQADRAAAG